MADKNAVLKARKMKASIFVLVVAIIFGGTLIWMLTLITYTGVRFYNRPEQSQLVEVVGKRMCAYTSSGKHHDYTSYVYIVSFKFPDGSVKELQIYRITPENSTDYTVLDKESYSSAYRALQEGDTGILIYQEVKNIEKLYKDDDMRYEGRFLISFERDSKYGELKIESTEPRFETWHFILLGALVIMFLFFIAFLVKVTMYVLKHIRIIKLDTNEESITTKEKRK